MKLTKQSLFKGTIILTIAAFITRILGFANGIVMANVLGPEGIGLIMMAMPVTGLLITLTTLGLPVAISKLVSEAEAKGDHHRVKKILIVSLTTTSILGFVFMAGTFLGAKFISTMLLTDKRAFFSLIAILPIVPIVAISAVLKGYFRGKQNMTPIALSQIIEHAVKIGVIFVLVQFLLPYGIEYAAAGAVLSSVIGEGISLLYLFSIFKWSKQKQFTLHHSFVSQIRKGKDTFFDLLQTGLPTTGSGLIHSIMSVIQPILITQSLALAGITTAAATKQYGIVMGYVFPLLMLPDFITHSLAVPLVPAISEARSNIRLVHRRINQAVKISLIVGIPSTILLYVFADQLTTLIYKSPEAGTYLKIMVPLFFLHYFRTPLQAVMVGLGKANIVLVNDFLDSLVRLAFIFILASNSEFGMNGVCLAMNISTVFGAFLDILTMAKLIGFTFHLTEFIKVLLSGIFMCFGGLITYHAMTGEIPDKLLQMITSITASLIIYLFFLLYFKVVRLRKWPMTKQGL
jgi:stage V sporulation protein B